MQNIIQDPTGQNINICYNQFINNENYYIAKNSAEENAIIPVPADDAKAA